MRVNHGKNVWLWGFILLPIHAWAASAAGWWSYHPLATSSVSSHIGCFVAFMAFVLAMTLLSFGLPLYPLVRVITHLVIVLSTVTLWGTILGVGFAAVCVVLGYACGSVPRAFELWDDLVARKPPPLDDKRSVEDSRQQTNGEVKQD